MLEALEAFLLRRLPDEAQRQKAEAMKRRSIPGYPARAIARLAAFAECLKEPISKEYANELLYRDLEEQRTLVGAERERVIQSLVEWLDTENRLVGLSPSTIARFNMRVERIRENS